MAKELKQTSISQEETVVKENKKVQPISIQKEDQTAPKGKEQAESTGSQTKQDSAVGDTAKKIINIDSISSIKLEHFSLKQKGKILVSFMRPQLEKIPGVSVWDDEVFRSRNNYKELVKHQLMNAIKDGHIQHPKYEFRYDEDGVQYKEVTIIPPEKKEKREVSANRLPEEPIELDDLNFGC